MSVGYTKDDKEIESFSTGVTVITASEEHQQTQANKTLKTGASHYTIVDLPKESTSPHMDRSDEDDSDHNDPYQQHMKGRVSPSPYTANTERARLFNAYVRSAIEEKLNTLIPISHQPRELVQQIIADTSLKFPEFATSVRKRIRTYLKSYRRSRRVKDMQAAAALATTYQTSSTNGVTKDQSNDEPINVAAIALPTLKPTHTSAIVTIKNPRNVDDETPEPKKPRLSVQQPTHYPPPPHTNLTKHPQQME